MSSDSVVACDLTLLRPSTSSAVTTSCGINPLGLGLVIVGTFATRRTAG